jgi:hypothetical protein
MVGKGFAKGFGERQGRSSLASHLRFACEIGAVLGVFSHRRTSYAFICIRTISLAINYLKEKYNIGKDSLIKVLPSARSI